MNTPTQKLYECQEQRRRKAAELFAQGLSNAEIGRRLNVSRTSVSHWYQIWQQQGTDGLKTGPPGQKSRLDDTQRQQIAAALLQGPQAHGFDTPLWTLQRITTLIARLTGVSYHPGHVWYLLGDLGWTCQKPEAQARERDQTEINRWLAQEWPRIKKGRKSEGPS